MRRTANKEGKEPSARGVVAVFVVVLVALLAALLIVELSGFGY